MYTDQEAVNGVVKGDMERWFRNAAQEHRLGHLKSIEGRVLSAIWTSVTGFIRQAFSVEKPGIARARKRLSY